jgi:hypothetical protein
MDPATGVNVLHGLRFEDDPERFRRLMDEISQDSAPWALAGLYELQSVIDPRETRDYLKGLLTFHDRRPGGNVGRHRLACWPTSF